MRETILLLCMLFCHIVDDYYLQGWLASAKQKSWWEKNAPNPLYKNDYIVALYEHAFSWTCMVHIPLPYFIEQIIIDYDDDKNYYLTFSANSSNNEELLDSIDFVLDDIGKTVFLTKKEAEAMQLVD